MQRQYLKLGHDRFLRNPFQFVVHQSTSTSYRLTLCQYCKMKHMHTTTQVIYTPKANLRLNYNFVGKVTRTKINYKEDGGRKRKKYRSLSNRWTHVDERTRRDSTLFLIAKKKKKKKKKKKICDVRKPDCSPAFRHVSSCAANEAVASMMQGRHKVETRTPPLFTRRCHGQQPVAAEPQQPTFLLHRLLTLPTRAVNTLNFF
jgi:hypothetical protein